MTQHCCYQPQSKRRHLRSDTLEEKLAWIGAEHGQIDWQARYHIEAERAVWVDVPPGQRRHPAPFVRPHPLGAGRLAQHALDHQRVHVDRAVLLQMERQHRFFLVLDALGGDLATTATNDEVVGRIAVLDHLQPLVDLAAELLDQLRAGDTVVVWKLDRLSRSLKDVLHIMEQIAEAGAAFRSVTENIDTTTPAGRMMMQMVGSFAEFERAMIRERISAGLATARAEGHIGGRRKKLDMAKRREIAESVITGRKSGADMAHLYNVSQPTISRIVAQHRQEVVGD